jgi:hypothetical protein
MGRPPGLLIRPWTAEDDDRLRQLVAEGWSRHAIAARLGRADLSVGRRAQAIQLELTVRARRQRSSGQNARSRHSRSPNKDNV